MTRENPSLRELATAFIIPAGVFVLMALIWLAMLLILKTSSLAWSTIT